MLTLELFYGKRPFIVRTEQELVRLKGDVAVELEHRNRPWKAHFENWHYSDTTQLWLVMGRKVKSLDELRDAVRGLDLQRLAYRDYAVLCIGATFVNALLPSEHLVRDDVNYGHFDTVGTSGSDIPSIYHIEACPSKKIVRVQISIEYASGHDGMEKVWRIIWSVQRKCLIDRKLRQLLTLAKPINEQAHGGIQRLRKEILTELATFQW